MKLVDRPNIQPFVKVHSQSCFSIPLDKELFQDLPRPNSTNTWSCCPVFQAVTSNPTRWEHGKWEQLPNMLQIVKPQPHTLDFQVAERLHGIRNVWGVQDQVNHPEPEKLSKKHQKTAGKPKKSRANGFHMFSLGKSSRKLRPFFSRSNDHGGNATTPLWLSGKSYVQVMAVKSWRLIPFGTFQILSLVFQLSFSWKLVPLSSWCLTCDQSRNISVNLPGIRLATVRRHHCNRRTTSPASTCPGNEEIIHHTCTPHGICEVLWSMLCQVWSPRIHNATWCELSVLQEIGLL